MILRIPKELLKLLKHGMQHLMTVYCEFVSLVSYLQLHFFTVQRFGGNIGLSRKAIVVIVCCLCL